MISTGSIQHGKNKHKYYVHSVSIIFLNLFKRNIDLNITMKYCKQLNWFEPKRFDEGSLDDSAAVFRIVHFPFSSLMVGQHRFVKYQHELQFLPRLIFQEKPTCVFTWWLHNSIGENTGMKTRMTATGEILNASPISFFTCRSIHDVRVSTVIETWFVFRCTTTRNCCHIGTMRV
jgi:hypothetical protein